MDTNSIDNFFNDWYQRYNELMGLPLYLTYDKFSAYYSITRTGADLCAYYIEKDIHRFDEIHRVCRTVEGILNHLDSDSYKELDDKCKPFEYVSYFLYDKIKNITNGTNLQELYGALDYILFKTIMGKNCDIIRFGNNNDEFDKRKELYFRGEILQWIKLKYETKFKYNHAFCKNYINECSRFYNKNIKDNYCEKFEHYAKELESFTNNFNETLRFLKGKQVNIEKTEIDLPNKSKCPSEGHGDRLTSQETNLGNNGQLKAEDSVSFHPLSVQLDSPNSNTNVTAASVSGTLIGISLLSLFFWKFTPLGSRIQHKIWGIKNNHNLENKTNENIIDTYDNEDIYSYNNEYNIQYHSA
ncbi:PIR Superfamily Protein [Plasmodium ovale curtisi]|uniref:PIR Superfamily Protein n=1 Tax=Plasmodium ovale curtisi TaxID=864141 RepID=A0A1A8WDS3_PLAOA|nr:PIR Superfamily Protein [Plasmodium ovale curtisi]